MVDFGRGRHLDYPLDNTAALTDPAPLPEELAIEHDEGDRIRNRLVHLTAKEHQLVDLRLPGLNDREIAEVLGMSHGAVRTMQYRALLRLRTLAAAPAAKEDSNVAG